MLTQADLFPNGDGPVGAPWHLRVLRRTADWYMDSKDVEDLSHHCQKVDLDAVMCNAGCYGNLTNCVRLS